VQNLNTAFFKKNFAVDLLKSQSGRCNLIKALAPLPFWNLNLGDECQPSVE